MNFNYFCRLGFAFILLAVTAQHSLFSMDIPSPTSSFEGDDTVEYKDLEGWPSMRFDKLDALFAQLEAQEYLIKAEASREATSIALQSFCSTVLPFCSTTKSLINMRRDATLEQQAAFWEMIHPLFDEKGQPEIGSWREIVYHLKGLAGTAPLHATQHILYQLRDRYPLYLLEAYKMGKSPYSLQNTNAGYNAAYNLPCKPSLLHN